MTWMPRASMSSTARQVAPSKPFARRPSTARSPRAFRLLPTRFEDRRQFAGERVPRLNLTGMTVEAWIRVLDAGPGTILRLGDESGGWALGVDDVGHLVVGATRSTIAPRSRSSIGSTLLSIRLSSSSRFTKSRSDSSYCTVYSDFG